MKDLIVLLASLLLVVASIYGWIANIVKLVDVGDGQITGMVLARVAGIVVPPVGAVLGYF